MSDNNSGGSPSVMSVEEGFGFGPPSGGTTNGQQSGSVLPSSKNGEGSHQQDGGSESKETQPNQAGELNKPGEQNPQNPAKPNEPSPPADDVALLKTQADDAREMVMDMLEEKFDQLRSGTLSSDQLKDWFAKHPELAETANRSKRLKDQYREFIDKPTDPNQPKPATQPAAKKDEKIDDMDKPLTAKDWQRLQQEADEKAAERSAKKSRKDALVKFASEHKIVDDGYKKLEANAEALFKANRDWSWSQCIEAAHGVINPRKGSPVQIPGGKMKGPEQNSQKVDASAPGGVSLMSAKEFSGGQIQD